MRSHERVRSLMRSPKLAWDILGRGRYSFIYDMMPVTLSGMSRSKRWNLVKAGGNLVRRRLRPWSMPLHMQFELTNYCNLRCPVCPVGIGAISRRRQSMDAGLFERVMDEVGPYLLTASLWAWGEPLLHPRLAEVLRAARKHDVATLLSTNGQKLDAPAAIDALIDEPPTYLIVALDGLTDDTNSQYRVGARLAPALEGVRRIAEIKRHKKRRLPILHMRFMVMNHNEHEVPGVEEFARRHSFDMLTMRTLSIIDTESPDAIHNGLVPAAAEFQAYGYEQGNRKERTDFICQEPFWFPTVLADGTVVACEQDYNARHALGAVADRVSFRDIWSSPRAAEVREIIRERPDTVSFCRNCPYSDRPVTHCSVEARFLTVEAQ